MSNTCDQKVADRIASLPKQSSQNDEAKNKIELRKERFISPEKKITSYW